MVWSDKEKRFAMIALHSAETKVLRFMGCSRPFSKSVKRYENVV